MRRSLVVVGSLLILAGCDDSPRWKVGKGGTFDAALCALAVPDAGFSNRCSSTGAPASLALGVCGSVNATAALTVEAPHRDALVAVNGTTTSTAELAVQGSLTSLQGIEAQHLQVFDGTVSTAGNWQTHSEVLAHADAFVGGKISAGGSMQIDGTLHVNDDQATGGAQAAAVSVGPVSVVAPLDCSLTPRAGQIVAEARVDRVGWADEVFDTDSLKKITVPSTVTLGCGRYYFDTVEVQDVMRFHIEGAVVMVVGGDFHVGGPTSFELSPGASLDLIVVGSMTVDSTLDIAVDGDPHATWIAVGNALHVGAPMTMSGSLVMPDGALQVDDQLSLTGSALVGSLDSTAAMTVHDGYALGQDGCAMAGTK